MVFQYDPECKRQSVHRNSSRSPRQKKARQTKFKFKAMIIVFLEIGGIIHVTWVSEGQTVYQVHDKEFLTHLRERLRRSPEMWKNDSCVLNQHNVPEHNAPSVKTF